MYLFFQDSRPSRSFNVISLRNDSYVEARLGRFGRYQRWLRKGGSSPIPARLRSWYGPLILEPNVQGRGRPQVVVDLRCPVDRQEAGETTRCVAVLEDDLRAVIIESYVQGGAVEQIVAELHCCRQTYYNRLYRAYGVLLGYFNDVAAGVPLPPIPVSGSSGLTDLDTFPTLRATLA